MARSLEQGFRATSGCVHGLQAAKVPSVVELRAHGKRRFGLGSKAVACTGIVGRPWPRGMGNVAVRVGGHVAQPTVERAVEVIVLVHTVIKQHKLTR